MGSWGAAGGAGDDGRDPAATFVAGLAEFAEISGGRRVSQLTDQLQRPVRIAVRGRRGVGATTLRAALSARGVRVTPGAEADIRVLVVVEALKPEERERLTSGPETLVVLNKADLCRSLPDGTFAEADRRAAVIQSDTGVRTMAVSALLAAAGCGPMDDEAVGALRVLCRVPADLRGVDAFVAAEHQLGSAARAGLLERLDRFGVAHAVAALTRGADAAGLSELMTDLSNVAALLRALRSAVAAVRYRRIRETLIEMRCLATEHDIGGPLDLVAGDAAVLAVMAAAVEVLECDGLRVDPSDRPAAHRARAVHWRRYGRGSVGALHRDCSAAVVRGSLRLLGEAL